MASVGGICGGGCADGGGAGNDNSENAREKNGFFWRKSSSNKMKPASSPLQCTDTHTQVDVLLFYY